MLGILIKKEFFEIFKTKKFIILPIVMIFFAITSVFTAYYMPEILATFGGQDADAINELFPDPTIESAYSSFLQNFNQIIYFVLIFIGTSTFINDKTKGRLTLLLSKPIKCSQLLSSKFIILSVQFIIAYIIGGYFFITATQSLFSNIDFIIFLQVSGLYLLYGLFLITLTMFNSVVFKSYMGSVLTTVAVFIGFGIFSILKADIIYLIPGNIVNLESQIYNQTGLNQTGLILNIISNIFFIVILFIGSIAIFKRQELD